MREEGFAFFVVDHRAEVAGGACLRADEVLLTVLLTVLLSVGFGLVDVVCSADGADFDLEGVSDSVRWWVGLFGGGEGELSLMAEEGSAVCHTG